MIDSETIIIKNPKESILQICVQSFKRKKIFGYKISTSTTVGSWHHKLITHISRLYTAEDKDRLQILTKDFTLYFW